MSGASAAGGRGSNFRGHGVPSMPASRSCLEKSSSSSSFASFDHALWYGLVALYHVDVRVFSQGKVDFERFAGHSPCEPPSTRRSADLGSAERAGQAARTFAPSPQDNRRTVEFFNTRLPTFFSLVLTFAVHPTYLPSLLWPNWWHFRPILTLFLDRCRLRWPLWPLCGPFPGRFRLPGRLVRLVARPSRLRSWPPMPRRARWRVGWLRRCRPRRGCESTR